MAVEVFSVPITSFNEERLVRVYVPRNYENETKKYPVLYMHDGQNVFHDKEAIGGTSLELENYLDENELEVIVVAIDQKSEERANEYCPWVNGEYSKKVFGLSGSSGGKGMQYVECIVNELKPLIDRKYRTLQNKNAMAGISLGGLISAYAMCRYPHIFQNVIIFSSAFYRNQEEIEKLIISSDLSAIQSLYMDCGTKEDLNNKLVSKDFLISNEAVYNILKEKIDKVEFAVIHDAQHHYDFFKQRIHKLFTFLKSREN